MLWRCSTVSRRIIRAHVSTPCTSFIWADTDSGTGIRSAVSGTSIHPDYPVLTSVASLYWTSCHPSIKFYVPAHAEISHVPGIQTNSKYPKQFLIYIKIFDDLGSNGHLCLYTAHLTSTRKMKMCMGSGAYICVAQYKKWSQILKYKSILRDIDSFVQA